MKFKEAVENAPSPVDSAHRPGLQALKSEHRGSVDCQDTRRLSGSIDLDGALAETRPNEPRWDYGIGHRVRESGEERAVWVEIHPASSKNVGEVLEKLAWLKRWLEEEAPDLDRITNASRGEKSFVWVATRAKVAIPKTSRQARQLAQAGLDFPTRRLDLS